MPETELLIPAILSRRSIRSFEEKYLSDEDHERVTQILRSIQPLFSENHFEIALKNREKNQNLVEILGAYGHFISPPYYFVPSIIGEKHHLVDLGFRMQQIAVRLWAKGIGSCFIGCLSRENKIHQKFNLPENSRITALLVFGYPGKGIGIQSLVDMGKIVIGNSGRKKIEDLFFNDDFNHPGFPPDDWKIIIECGRMSPSAINAQPWRFLLSKNQLFLFINQKPRQYLLPENDEYCYFDGGICMANIEMAVSSLGFKGKWEMIEKELGITIPPNLESLHALAKLTIKK